MSRNGPEARARLGKLIGKNDYNRLLQEQQCVITVVNGHCIRVLLTRIGWLFTVGNACRVFSTFDQAKAFAERTGKP
jgi:hypothetical protein